MGLVDARDPEQRRPRRRSRCRGYRADRPALDALAAWEGCPTSSSGSGSAICRSAVATSARSRRRPRSARSDVGTCGPPRSSRRDPNAPPAHPADVDEGSRARRSHLMRLGNASHIFTICQPWAFSVGMRALVAYTSRIWEGCRLVRWGARPSLVRPRRAFRRGAVPRSTIGSRERGYLRPTFPAPRRSSRPRWRRRRTLDPPERRASRSRRRRSTRDLRRSRCC